MAESASEQTWNAANYAAHGRFVATMASEIVANLHPRPGEHILDAGCGDGALTEQIAAAGATVTGVDSSPAMVEAARARGLQVDLHDLKILPYRARFDAVFSNAALHWTPLAQQPALLTSLFTALKPGGRLVAEMGGQGNIAAIRTALRSVFAPFGLDPEILAASCFPSPGLYQSLLEECGFQVHSVKLVARPTPLPDGAEGMRQWLETFRNGVLDALPPAAREAAREQAIALLRPILSDGRDGSWTADYVRLRIFAERPRASVTKLFL